MDDLFLVPLSKVLNPQTDGGPAISLQPGFSLPSPKCSRNWLTKAAQPCKGKQGQERKKERKNKKDSKYSSHQCCSI